VVGICSHPGQWASTWSWIEASPLVDEALGPPRQQARPAATKAGGSPYTRAAEGSRGCHRGDAVPSTDAKARDQKR
jgi:hypothetical protein